MSTLYTTNQSRRWSPLTLAQPASKPSATLDQETLLKLQALQNRFFTTADSSELALHEPALRRLKIEQILNTLVEEMGLALTPQQYNQCITFIQNEALGYGPLSPLINHPEITEIMVNGPNRIFVEQKGELRLVEEIAFHDEKHLRALIERIVARVGRRIDEASPSVDARLEDGSRVNILIPPLSLDGPMLTIRKFQQEPYDLDELVRLGALRLDMADFLQAAVRSRLSIVVSGGTGAGKTTMLNALAAYINPQERIVTVEDSAELKFHQQHKHVIRTETRPPNIQGMGEVTIRHLVRNALRMRPDRIIVGEVRGAEALDMLQAMNTGHEGSMTTLHANAPEDALRRIETMVRWAEGAANLPNEAIREQIASAIDLIIQVSRYGLERKVASISEVQGLRRGKIVVKELFRFDLLHSDPVTRKVMGRFDATGVTPRNLERLELRSGAKLRHYFTSSLVAETLQDYLQDESVTEIMINGPKDAYIEKRDHGLQPITLDFSSPEHLLGLIKSITASSGKLLDKQHPTVDDRLPDGSRVNAVIHPIAPNGPVLTIRKFPKQPWQMDDLGKRDMFSPAMVDFLAACVKARLNLLISGGTGSGKTTLLNALTSFIGESGRHDRIVTIEDVAELQLQHDHWIRLEAQPVDDYGEGGVSIRDLVINALRMRPDRIIVGEVRGGEALDMLQAMNTGHEGSMTTIHANSPADALSRLATMVTMAGVELPAAAVQAQIAGAIDIVVQVSRTADNKRRVTAIAEVIKQPGHLRVQEIFAYRLFTTPAGGSATGHCCLVSQPACLERLQLQGVTLPPATFTPLLTKAEEDR